MMSTASLSAFVMNTTMHRASGIVLMAMKTGSLIPKATWLSVMPRSMTFQSPKPTDCFTGPRAPALQTIPA